MLFEKLLGAVPEGTPSDPNFKNVTMLLPGDVNQGLTYTALNDASSNNFLITPNGGTYGTSFSPYNTSWSNYFDILSGDYLSASSPNLNGSWTIEGWFYRTVSSTQQSLVFGDNGSYSGVLVYINSNNYLQVNDGITAQSDFTGATIPVNEWFHIAIVRNGTTTTGYLNGSAIGSNSFTPATTSRVNIGFYFSSSPFYFTGYASNVRIVNGTAVYTGTFTPPSLANLATSGAASAACYSSTTNVNTSFAASATSLLTCQSNRFIDNSTNAYAITVTGSPDITSFSLIPDTNTTSGSGYFNGSNAYINTPNTGQFVAAGDFTISLWYYPLAFTGSNSLLGNYTVNATTDWRLQVNSSGVLQCYTNGGTVRISSAAGAVKLNRWHYITLARSGTTITAYINGTQVGSTYTQSTSFGSATKSIYSGFITGFGYVNGYISDIRLLNGVVDTTVPTTQQTNTASTSLLTLQYRGEAQNIGFVDSSANKAIISYTGSPTQGTFSPYGNLWSNYFDGSGDYLVNTSSSAVSFGTADFTVEYFIYTPVAPSGYSPHIGTNDSTSTNVSFGENNGVLYATTITTGYSTGVTLPLNQWNYVAWVRTSGTLKCYLNGTQIYSTSFTTNVSSSGFGIGYVYASGTTYVTGQCYLSNVRVVKGTALSISSTPTSPLTAVSGTSLLTCQSNRFIDNSANNFTITVNGNTSVQRFSPFNPTAAYSASTIGGGGYFGSYSDKCTSPAASLVTGTGAFTVECWLYPTQGNDGAYGSGIALEEATPDTDYITIWKGDSGFGNEFIFQMSGWSTIRSYMPAGVAQWNHCVMVRNAAGNTSCYVNGQRVYNASNTYDFTKQMRFIFGGYGSSSYGVIPYQSDVRVVNGVAVYDPTSATLTVPTAPLTAVSGTQFLCNMTNAGIWDAAMMNDLQAVGNARVVTTVKKYNTGSIYFDGTGDYLTSNPATTNLYTFGSGDFTVEFWVYLNATQTSIIYDTRPLSTQGVYPCIYLVNNAIIYNTDSVNRITGTTLSNLTWYHIAVCRSGTSTKLFVNGTQSGSTYTDSNVYLGSAQRPIIGNGFDLSYALNGYIDDLRVTKGYARYPTEPFPTAALPLY